MPSVNFQNALASFERLPAISARNPGWLRMTLALEEGYRTLSEAGTLSNMFDTTNEFDRALLVWCHEAQNREHQAIQSHDMSMPFPSIRFQEVLRAFQHSLERQMPKIRLPHLVRMGAAVHFAYRTLRHADAIEAMVQPDNSFDMAMLVWCLAADQRSSGCKQLSRSELSRN